MKIKKLILIVMLVVILPFILLTISCKKDSKIEELENRIIKLEEELSAKEETVNEATEEPAEEENIDEEQSPEIEYYKDRIQLINVELQKIMDALFKSVARRSKGEISEEDSYDMVFSVPIWIDEIYVKFLKISPPDEIKDIHIIYEKAFEYYLGGAEYLKLSGKVSNKVDIEPLENGINYFQKADMLIEKGNLALEDLEGRAEIISGLEEELKKDVDIPAGISQKEVAEEPAEEEITEEISESDISDNDLNIQPIIESFSDSLGNSTTVSIAKENWDAEPSEETTVYIGDVITFKVITSDAENIEYKFYTPSMYDDQWNSSNEFIWNVTEEDFGKDKQIQVNIRNNDGLNWLSDCDDTAVLRHYTVLSK